MNSNRPPKITSQGRALTYIDSAYVRLASVHALTFVGPPPAKFYIVGVKMIMRDTYYIYPSRIRLIAHHESSNESNEISGLPAIKH